VTDLETNARSIKQRGHKQFVPPARFWSPMIMKSDVIAEPAEWKMIVFGFDLRLKN